jgi:beta-glucosidase
MKMYNSVNIDFPLDRGSFGKDFIWGISALSPTVNNSIVHEFDFSRDFKNDIVLLKQLGINNYKFSISWSMILPEGTGTVNPIGIDLYNDIINTCLANGIEPFITLQHNDLPRAIAEKGGWVNREIIHWFAEYISVCIHVFKDRVKNWIIFDNLLFSTGANYFLGLYTPDKKKLHHFLPTLHHILLCQSLGYKLAKEISPSANVGTSIFSISITPKVYSEKDIKAASRVDALVNRLFIEPSLGLGYPIEELTFLKGITKFFHKGDEELLKVEYDFIGLQCYTREVIEHNSYIPYLNAKIVSAKKRNVLRTNMDWEIYPKSILDVIKKFNQYEGIKNIIITENGASFSDELVYDKVHDSLRITFIKESLKELLKGIEITTKVKGYFVSSLHDSYNEESQQLQRFGLVHTDFSTQKRTIKDSGFWYGRFLSGKIKTG